MEKSQHHLVIEAGPEKGRTIYVMPLGIRVGRSSKNDVEIKDPVMSRFHCRFFFKPEGGLWVEDLGSSNQTLLNQSPVRESRLQIGDVISLGDTLIKVVNDAPSNLDSAGLNLFGAPSSAAGGGGIDLRNGNGAGAPVKKPARAKLTALLLMLATAALVLFFLQYHQKFWPENANDTEYEHEAESPARAVSIYYEKVQADAGNIFQYVLELENNELSIQVTDLQNKRQVAGQQRKKVLPELIDALADSMEQTDFFELKESYQGVAPQAWNLIDLSVTIGSRTHEVRVLNTMEPETVKTVREIIESFGQNELGLAALALAPDKLIELARAAELLGRSLYDQREVKHDNLAKSIRSLNEVEWYLETVEPKPDFYAGAMALRKDAEKELQEISQRLTFLAERAYHLKDWNEAAINLRLLCEKIPDRVDSRHQNARKKLIEVERYLKKK